MFHDARAKYVKQTWGKRCDKLLFFSDTVDTQLETIDLKVGRGRGGLRNKTVMALDLLYKEYVHDYDWFMKADDDTFVIVENLRYLLSEHSPSDPVWFGHRFKRVVSQGYLSGGAGYVLSRKALQKFGTRPTDCISIRGAEDVELGRCMQKLGVKIGDSRDAFGKSRFHSFPAEDHLTEFYPDWYYLYDWYNATSVSIFCLHIWRNVVLQLHIHFPIETYRDISLILRFKWYQLLKDIDILLSNELADHWILCE